MTDTLLRPTAFALAHLTLVDMGPLRGTTSLPLTDEEGKPTNLFLMMGPNGSGKTTILDAIYRAMALLSSRAHNEYGNDALDSGDGGLQLDARVVLDDGARSRAFMLSIVAGGPGLLKDWTADELETAEVDEQIVLAFQRRSATEAVLRAQTSHPSAVSFHDAVIAQLGDQPRDLFETAAGYPTVLYFPSNRGIRRPPRENAITRPAGYGYAPAHLFDTDGASWASSLDNLFVWFAWLDDGRDERCRDIVNSLVFRGTKRLGAVDRQNLFVPVEVQETGASHRLDQLSSGERQLVQLVVRIASHMAGSTIVLIDETEQHLHVVMRRRLMAIMKDWAKSYPQLAFLFTSHQPDTFRLLAPSRAEPGLRKSASLVKPRYRPGQ
ncbi:hypothetical protein BWQ93_03275 [Sphingopyxis sp. QXT-31]|uniref:AAA family ATPase n=1 Tax=Sphingopyxis sp. QXT-31 TaxID=1357916 RepID=UPI00097916E4|nr:AAA family ATPase [Sphingopyxis sp. QXT-31]APZ97615.1 hypothetical protein BWQ93_03275 [Sphingopyxis sp. QXT-31]